MCFFFPLDANIVSNAESASSNLAAPPGGFAPGEPGPSRLSGAPPPPPPPTSKTKSKSKSDGKGSVYPAGASSDFEGDPAISGLGRPPGMSKPSARDAATSTPPAGAAAADVPDRPLDDATAPPAVEAAAADKGEEAVDDKGPAASDRPPSDATAPPAGEVGHDNRGRDDQDTGSSSSKPSFPRGVYFFMLSHVFPKLSLIT